MGKHSTAVHYRCYI